MPENLYDRLHAIDRRLSIHEATVQRDLKAIEEARSIQAAEYARRLDILNGEANRLRQMQETYVPREVYEQKHAELQKEVDEVKTYRDTSIGRQALIAAIIPIIISLLFLWLSAKSH